MYADDTVVFTSGSDEAKVTRDVQSLFNHVISWCDANKLTINEKKTKKTVFNNKDDLYTDHIVFKNKPLEPVRNYRYLGVDICDDLNMDTFVWS